MSSTISSSVSPFSSCLQSSPASGSFPMSQLFASGSQSTVASATACAVISHSVVSNSWTAACQGFPVHHQFLELAQIHVHQVSDTILCCFLLLLPSIFPSIRVFSKESVLHIRCPKYWSFSISPSNEHSGLISFRIDWLYLLAVQGTLKSLLQLHNSKTSVLQHSVFFMVQLSHPYMTIGKTIALTIWAFVSKVMSLFFNTLFRFIIAFLPRSRCLLISWLQ